MPPVRFPRTVIPPSFIKRLNEVYGWRRVAPVHPVVSLERVFLRNRSQQKEHFMRFIPKLFIAGGFALCASVAGPVAASQAAPTATSHAVIGIGTWSGGSFGTPTLAVGATTYGMATSGGFAITYPRDVTSPAASTAVLGTVTCLDVVNGDTAYIAGLIKSSSGPRAEHFPGGGLHHDGCAGGCAELQRWANHLPRSGLWSGHAQSHSHQRSLLRPLSRCISLPSFFEIRRPRPRRSH